MPPLDASELYTGFSPIRASHVKQFFDLLTGITTDQAVQLKNGLTVTNGLTVVSGGATVTAGGLTVSAGTTTLASLLDLSGASAGQIKFPASQNASANANTLDDYEEGTWTSANGGSTTYVSRTAAYVKVGILVSCWFDHRINLIGTGSATTLTGGPFASSGGLDGAGSVASLANLAVNQVFVSCKISSGTSTFVFPSLAAAGASTADAAIMGNTTIIQGQVSYLG